MARSALPVPEPRKFSIIRPRIGKENWVGSQERPRKPRMPTPENPLIISASELRDFLRCRVKWNWRYQVRIEPKERSINLKIGGITHEILEKWYSLGNRTVKAMRWIANAHLMRISPEYLSIEDVELIRAMCVGYAGWAKSRDLELGMANIRTERWFSLPLDERGTIIINGKIDVDFKQTELKRTRAGMEHKTAGQFRDNILELNLQSSVYLWAMRMLYPKAKRYIMHRNTLRKQMPGPRVKADLFRREPIERSDDEIDQWRTDTVRTALDMIDAAIYPSPADDCSYLCDFQMPCLLRGRPEDLEFTLRQDYVSRNRS